MPTRRLARAACALATIVALVAFTGCGGSDKKSSSSSSSSSATTPTPATTSTVGGSSGGGSSELAAYKAAATKAAGDFKIAAQAASAKVTTATTVTERIAALDELKAVFNKGADDFAALKPPADIKPDNDELVAELRSFSSHVNDVEQAFQSGDQQKAAAAFTQLEALQTKVGTTIATIQTKIGG